MNRLKSAKTKIAFTGTNCSGKTTMALEVTARLKYPYNVLAECVTSQDRKVTWEDAHFPDSPKAHYGMMCNLINAEVSAELRGDADIVITDRSVLDLFSIAVTDHPDHELTPGLRELMLGWIKTYTKIYYLPPLKYQEDGKRPQDEFRQKTHSNLQGLIEAYRFENVIVGMTRDEITKDIRGILGLQEIKPVFAETEKWQAVCDAVGYPLLVKNIKSPITSDVDVWFFVPPTEVLLFKQELAVYVTEMYFGTQLDIHCMAAPDTALAKVSSLGEHKMFQPTFPF